MPRELRECNSADSETPLWLESCHIRSEAKIESDESILPSPLPPSPPPLPLPPLSVLAHSLAAPPSSSSSPLSSSSSLSSPLAAQFQSIILEIAAAIVTAGLPFKLVTEISSSISVVLDSLDQAWLNSSTDQEQLKVIKMAESLKNQVYSELESWGICSSPLVVKHTRRGTRAGRKAQLCC